VGFEVVSYTGYYGHVFYERLAPLAARSAPSTR